MFHTPEKFEILFCAFWQYVFTHVCLLNLSADFQTSPCVTRKIFCESRKTELAACS